MHIRNQPYNLQTSLYYGIWYVFLFKSLTQGKFSQKQQHYFLLFWGVKKHHYFFSFWHVKYIEFPSMGISQINITHVMFFFKVTPRLQHCWVTSFVTCRKIPTQMTFLRWGKSCVRTWTLMFQNDVFENLTFARKDVKS